MRDSRAPRCDFAFPVQDYDLDATLTSGQVFGWEPRAESWIGVVTRRRGWRKGVASRWPWT